MLSELSRSPGERATRRLGIQRWYAPRGRHPVPLGQRRPRQVFPTTMMSLKPAELSASSTTRTDYSWTNAARYIIGEPRFRVRYHDRSRDEAFRQRAAPTGIDARAASCLERPAQTLVAELPDAIESSIETWAHRCAIVTAPFEPELVHSGVSVVTV